MKIPVIGNGDIDGSVIAAKMFDQHGVDGIMIGRAAIGKPWIFREIKQYFETGELPAPPSLEEVVGLAKHQLDRSIHYKGEPRGIYEMRKQFIRYFKGLPDFKPYRIRLVTSLDRLEIEGILDEILNNYRDHVPSPAG
jgi:tRNA-dihydrouridine synthase